MSGTLLIRADASPHMGTGHVMRSLALAQAWQDQGGEVAFAMADRVAKIDARLEREGMKLAYIAAEPGKASDMEATIAAAHSHGARWVVLDGYQFRGDFQKALKDASLQVMALDDYGHCEHYWADIILNQDVNANAGFYTERELYTQLLLGTNYVLLRREFSSIPRPTANIPATARRLLVTLGGADPWNFTTRIVRALNRPQAAELEVTVVVGPGNPFCRDVEAAAQEHAGRMRVLGAPPDMPRLMQECDLAISAGGGTMWELAYFRVPSMVLVLADNQVSTARILKQRQACRVIENAIDMDEESLCDEICLLARDEQARRALAETFGNLIDGRGAARVCNELRSPLPASCQRKGDEGVVASF